MAKKGDNPQSAKTGDNPQTTKKGKDPLSELFEAEGSGGITPEAPKKHRAKKSKTVLLETDLDSGSPGQEKAQEEPSPLPSETPLTTNSSVPMPGRIVHCYGVEKSQ